jgi:hypothetical protein
VTSNFYSQTKNSFYKVNNKSTSDLHYLGMQLEFKKETFYFNNNHFKEIVISNGVKKDSVEYKILNKAWYYKEKNKWNLYFNFKTKKGGYIYVSKQKYKIKFIERIHIKNKKLDALYLKPFNAEGSHLPVFLFDPNQGIILISNKSIGVNVVKDVFFDTPLNEKEENLILSLKAD